MERIMTWDVYFKDSPLIRPEKLRQRAAKRGVSLGVGVSLDVELSAIVNAGRWCVLCPWCHGGEFAREDGLFMCQSCWNGSIKRLYARAKFPPNRAEIEEMLIRRLDPQTRNWKPEETLDFLRQEEVAHGMG